MPYSGKTFQIPCSTGGFNHNPNLEAIAPNAMIDPSRNINTHNGYRQPRGGTAKINGTAVSGTPQIMGIVDYILPAGTQFIVFATNDGKIYKNSTTTIKTSLASSVNMNFTIFNDTLYCCNGSNVVQTWDGAAGATSNITNPAADWTTNQPIQMLVHGKGASERLWAVCGTKNIYASANGSDNFVTGVINFSIETKDEYGLIAMLEWQDNLIAFGKRQAFIINDTDASTANWGYSNAPWNGGVGNHRLLVKTDNDVLVMSVDGDIYSLTAVLQAGDYKAASVARPAFIDKWIRENIDLAQIAKFHGLFDPVLRAVKFFMVSTGASQVDICLPFFIDKPALEAWGCPHENDGNISGYNASCSAWVRKAVGNYKIYTGDYSGFIWELETTNLNDDSNSYYKGFTFPYCNLDVPVQHKLIWKGRLVTEPEGDFFINTNIWVDNDAVLPGQVSLAGMGAVLDSFVLDTDVLGGQFLIDGGFDIGSTGKRIKGEFYNNAVNEDFRISQIQIHFREIGIRP